MRAFLLFVVLLGGVALSVVVYSRSVYHAALDTPQEDESPRLESSSSGCLVSAGDRTVRLPFGAQIKIGKDTVTCSTYDGHPVLSYGPSSR